MPDANLFKTLGRIAGIGGIAFGLLILVFGEFLRKSIFPTLNTGQAYNILKLLLLLTFAAAVIGVIVWAVQSGMKPAIVLVLILFAIAVVYMGNQRLSLAESEEKHPKDPTPLINPAPLVEKPEKPKPIFKTVFVKADPGTGHEYVTEVSFEKNDHYTQPGKPRGDGHEVTYQTAASGPVYRVQCDILSGGGGGWTHTEVCAVTDNGQARWEGWSNSGAPATVKLTLWYQMSQQVCDKNCD